MRQVGKVCLAFLLTVSSALGQSPAGSRASTKKAPSAASPSVTSRLEQMEKALQAQQQQITQLQNQLKSRDSQVEQLQQQLTQTQSSVSQAEQDARAAAANKGVQPEQLDALKKDIADIQGVATNSALALQETQKSIKEAGSPLALHYKGITVTPGGFLAAETVYRNRALASEATNFNSVNYPGSGANRISEFYGSGRQSRISMLGEGKVGNVKMSGYYEADFLSAGVTSNNNQTNSYTMRQRQVWGQAAFSNGVTFTGGQMWTLATETKKGVDNRTEAVPMTIDPNYTVGFSFARQWGVRLAKNFSNRVWLAASLENPQTTFAATNNASNFALGGLGAGGSLYNTTANYSFNAMPDIIAKAAFEPGFGHYEIFGIFSRFRDRVYPCVETAATAFCGGSTTPGPNALTAFNSSKNGGGVGGNARVTFFKKHVDFGVHALYGNGIGRYSASGLPDATVNPDGTLGLLRSYQGLATLEFHFPKIDVYFNGGEDYSGRRFQTDSFLKKVVGYGAPAFSDSGCYAETAPSANSGFAFGSISCSGNTQRTIEGSLGFWIKVLSGSKGRLQFGPQYSYLVRDAWTGTFGAGLVAPHGIDNLFYTSFRYYLP